MPLEMESSEPIVGNATACAQEPQQPPADQNDIAMEDESATSSQGTVLTSQPSVNAARVCGGECGQAKAAVAESGASLTLNRLRAECTCPICHDGFVQASTLRCGHSFCKVCIDLWLCEQHSCPVCRVQVEKVPVRALCLDNTAEIAFGTGNSGDDKTGWSQRKQDFSELQSKDEAAKAELDGCLTFAREQGRHFLNIRKVWNAREQHRFRMGIKQHKGLSRVAYCKSVGLTPEFLACATLKCMTLAARNMCVRNGCIPVSSKSAVDIDGDALMNCAGMRDRLMIFMQYS